MVNVLYFLRAFDDVITGKLLLAPRSSGVFCLYTFGTTGFLTKVYTTADKALGRGLERNSCTHCNVIFLIYKLVVVHLIVVRFFLAYIVPIASIRKLINK